MVAFGRDNSAFNKKIHADGRTGAPNIFNDYPKKLY